MTQRYEAARIYENKNLSNFSFKLTIYETRNMKPETQKRRIQIPQPPLLKGVRGILICKVLIALVLMCMAGCAGEDYMPVYFKPVPKDPDQQKPVTSISSGAECNVSYTAQLCVAIKDKTLDVGTKEENKLCAEIPPFPMHVKGQEVTILGSEFPDVDVTLKEYNLSLMLNGKGPTDGTKNIGKGEISADGNVIIQGFSFYIYALQQYGEVPNITLTTGETEKLEFLDAIKGSPPDVSGAMTLVAGVKLGQVLKGSEKLMGASLTATFTGTLSPTFKECGESSEDKTIKLTEYQIDSKGVESEVPLQNDDLILVSTGTFMSRGPSDVGGNFEAKKKYKAKNTSKKTIKYQLPHILDPFYISSSHGLSGNIKPNGFIIIEISFRPDEKSSSRGKNEKTLMIGTDAYTLSGIALTASGKPSLDTIGNSGETDREKISDLELAGLALPANPKQEYFECKEISCSDSKAYSGCKPCHDPSGGTCVLLQTGQDKKPLEERDDKCKLINPDAIPLLILDLKGSAKAEVTFTKQVIGLRNKGVSDLEIKDIRIEDFKNSKSTGEFTILKDEIFIADSFSSEKKERVSFPLKLKPYTKGISEQSAFITIAYSPADLIGSDGSQAGVGSHAIDRAYFIIETGTEKITTPVAAKTSVREDPPLELYFKTSIGIREIKKLQQFPFSGVTAQTTDVAFPLFLKPSDSAQNTLRITGIKIKGDDAKHFQFLDTEQKIKSIQFNDGIRCTVPTFDSKGNLTEEKDPKPVNITSSGLDLKAGAFTVENMPNLGCVNFHREKNEMNKDKNGLFLAELEVTSQEVQPNGTPAKNADGSIKESTMTIYLAAVINPKKGMMVLRITQTMAAILNKQFPSLSSIASYEEALPMIKDGKIKLHDLQVFTAAVLLDPFDDDVLSADDKKILYQKNDGSTAMFKAVSSHPSANVYDDDFLFDYAALSYDSSLPLGKRGIFEGYPNLPKDLKTNSWRIFTGSLSYPGPIAPPEKKAFVPSHCIIPNPCSDEEMKLFSSKYVNPNEKGACAFFYASAGKWGSPAFTETADGGEKVNLCQSIDKPQNIFDMDKGKYSIDGHLTFENMALRLFGPTFVHNPFGPIPPVPPATKVEPLDVILHISFTTSILKPKENSNEPETIPDKRITPSEQNYLINLTDKSFTASPSICERNIKNLDINGKMYSSWKYLAPFLSKDPDGKILTGCPEENNDLKGGLAYLHGRPINHETGEITLVSVANFGSDDDLTFAFKDSIVFLILNGWLCDPNGSPERGEGEKCYNTQFNKERDIVGQISIID